MIFISYRKEDAEDLARSLAEKLAVLFGKEYIFLDRDQIQPGDSWRKEIDLALSKALVVLAVIGRRWLTTYDDFGRRRIDREDDVLAYELSTAIEAMNRGIVIIPLYLHGMEPLKPEAFPSRLVGLAGPQGIKFDIDRDINSLVSKLEKIPGLSRKNYPSEPKSDDSASTKKSKPWCIPDSIGSLFKGREEAVHDLRQRFLQDHAKNLNNTLLRQVITGLGGIGKTRLAIEYAWEYHDSYSALLFVVGDTPAQLRRSMAELSIPEILNLQEWKYSEEEVRMAAVIRWLYDNPGWLLIIDNADGHESVDAVQHLLASLRGGHVIITSRNSSWNKSVTKCGLDVLLPEAAKTFLLARTNDERRKTPQDEDVALELATELGGLALALEQAGAYIQNRDGGLSLAEYLERWREGRQQVLAWCDPSVMQYARSVAITWETTMCALSPAALTLFRILSWFAPDPIPRSMVSNPGVLKIIRQAVDASQFTCGEIDPEQALSELIAYSMTKKVDEQGIACVGLHRVVLQIMRERMPLEAKGPTIVAAAQVLVLFAPKESYRHENWKDWRLLISHTEMIWRVMTSLPEEYWDLELMKMLALYYMGQERNEEGVPIQREVLRLVQKHYPSDHPEIYLAENDLALMLDNSAEDERESLYKAALVGRRSVHAEESEEVAETLHNYGCFLNSCGRVTEAEQLIRQALNTHAKVNGKLHWRTLMAESSLASILFAMGEVAQAETIICSLIENKRLAMGEDHHDTLDSLSFLASLYENKGDYSNAIKLLNQIYETRNRVMGQQHPSTIKALTDLAYFFCRIDNCTKAELLLKQSLEICERMHGINHYYTYNSMNDLAQYYSHVEDYAHAEPLYHRAVEGMKKVRGHAHPETLMMISNLAQLLHLRGKNSEAELLFKDVMNTHERERGSTHQMTLTSMNRLAMFFNDIDDEMSAEKMYRNALKGLETKRGMDHRDTLTVVGNLAELKRKNGDYTEAEALFRRIVETNKRLYGPDHLMTYNSMNTLGLYFARTSNFSLAEENYRQALEGKQRIQGPKHPETLTLMNNLADLLCKKGDHAQSGDLFRKVLETNEHELGQEHPDTLSSLLNLAELLEKAGNSEESLKFRDIYIERMIVKRDSASLISLRSLALQFYLKCDYKRAEELLHNLLNKDFEIPGTCCHLARIYLIMEKEKEAREVVEKAWVCRNEAKPYILPRILFFKIIFSMLDATASSQFLSEIKHLLKHESAVNEWKIQPVLNQLKGRLDSKSLDFLEALAIALGDRKEISNLDHFLQWQAVQPKMITD
ncbi:MAG: FxSxx-COOH system tetratricopeptide repeat protein [Bacteroidetes bacterium]|nr:FxSxx-COOH system tetratricopeptide repeat protein [Bacteroidota bacterium]